MEIGEGLKRRGRQGGQVALHIPAAPWVEGVDIGKLRKEASTGLALEKALVAASRALGEG